MFNLFDSPSVLNTGLFDVNPPEHDLKMIETCRNISGLYVKAYF
jgi:hypothetical protein